MASCVKINSKWVAKKYVRLDAKYYAGDGQKEARRYELNNIPKRNLKELTKGGTSGIFIPARFKRNFVENEVVGYPYIKGSEISKTEPLMGCSFLSKKYTKNVNRLLFKLKSTIITCSGVIGNTLYVTDSMDNVIGTPDLLRVIPDFNKIQPGYLYAFLSSKIGKALVTQHTYGSVVQHIEAHHLYDLPVPILSESLMKEIHQLIEESARLRSEANDVVKSNIRYIEQQFRCDKSKKKSELKTFSIHSMELFGGDKYTTEKRLEADYYLPATTTIIKNIEKSSDYALLGDISKRIYRSGLRERVFVKKGIVLFTGQNLNLLRPDRSKQLSKKLTRNISQNITLDGDVLISCLGTIGKIELVHKNFYEGVFASEHMINLCLDKDKIHPGYVYCFLLSELGQKQLLKYKTGSVIEWIRENHVASIIVPVQKDKGKKIGESTYQAVEKRQLAYELETKAISMVEKELN